MQFFINEKALVHVIVLKFKGFSVEPCVNDLSVPPRKIRWHEFIDVVPQNLTLLIA
jgi:hypothetical protein